MTRIYVGNLPVDIRTKDVEDLFFKYGRIRDIDCKTPARPPAFAFVDFERYEDAEDAIRGRGDSCLSGSDGTIFIFDSFYTVTDGVQFEGQRLRVEMSRGKSDGDDRSRRTDDRYSHYNVF